MDAKTKLIKDASLNLKFTDATDWQEDGRPSLKAIQRLAKDNSITQEDVDTALPDLKRDSLKPRTKDTEPKTGRGRAVEAVHKARNDKRSDKQRAIDDGHDWLENEMVVAEDVGYYGGLIREPGDRFVFTGAAGSWFRKLSRREVSAAQKEREDEAADEAGDE